MLNIFHVFQVQTRSSGSVYPRVDISFPIFLLRKLLRAYPLLLPYPSNLALAMLKQSNNIFKTTQPDPPFWTSVPVVRGKQA